MSFKVVCTDIDGTLLDSNRQLSPVTIDTFRRLAADIHVILASSRMPSAMTHLQRELGVLHNPLICYNGGYVIDYNGKGTSPEVIYSTFIPATICHQINSLASGTNIHVSLYFQDEWFAPQWDYWSEREARITKVQPLIEPADSVIARWIDQNIGGHKVMCMGPEPEIDAMEQELNRTLHDHIHVYRSRPTYLELAPKIISKGSALEMLLQKRYDVSMNEVIAFGDNYNDIDLLKLAGKGVAVLNAREEVLATADEVTLDSKADGVAVALRKYFSLA
jgi:Cof subfamily protein (haloacid dehalogenase superfamily)